MDAKVSFDAVYRRLKRALAQQGTTLHKCRRDSEWWNSMGDHYSADANNHCNGTHLDVVAMARELHLLGSHEVVAD
jgi:hypothetical protein